jgi:predicted amino acid racemase
MNDSNPYKSPITNDSHGRAKPLVKIGTVVLIVGVLALGYGVLGSFVIRDLPPNVPATGRLNSIYVMGIGAIFSIVGLVLRDFRLSRGKKTPTDH